MNELVNVSVFKRIFLFYYEGFRSMSSLGRTLWLIILIKLFLFFVVLKLFFFRAELSGLEDWQKSERVATELLK